MQKMCMKDVVCVHHKFLCSINNVGYSINVVTTVNTMIFYDSYGYHKSQDSLLLCMRDAGGRTSGLSVKTFILSINS
jgi:hypothetical protein